MLLLNVWTINIFVCAAGREFAAVVFGSDCYADIYKAFKLTEKKNLRNGDNWLKDFRIVRIIFFSYRTTL